MNSERTAILVLTDGERINCRLSFLRELQHHGIIHRVRMGLYQVLPHDNERIIPYIKKRCSEAVADDNTAST